MSNIFSYTYLPSVYFFGELSVKVFRPSFNWLVVAFLFLLVVFLLLSFKSSSYILDNSSLSDFSFVSIWDLRP